MRFPPKTILMPFAFSDPSFAAWAFARSLAQRFGAALVAVHVYEWTMPAEGLPPRPLSPDDKLKVKERLAEKVGPDISLRFAEGGVVSELLKAARETEADLIIMATAGRTGLRRLVRDSVTEQVVRKSPVPVLSVHGYAPAPASVLAPVNMQPYSLAGLEAAEAWAEALALPLTVLHVQERRDQRSGVMTRVALRQRAARSPARARLSLSKGDPVEGILAQAPGHGLVVLVAHRKGLLRDAILGTTAQQILRRCAVPVLTIPGQAAEAPPRAGRRSRSRRRLAGVRRGAKGGRAARR